MSLNGSIVSRLRVSGFQASVKYSNRSVPTKRMSVGESLGRSLLRMAMVPLMTLECTLIRASCERRHISIRLAVLESVSGGRLGVANVERDAHDSTRLSSSPERR